MLEVIRDAGDTNMPAAVQVQPTANAISIISNPSVRSAIPQHMQSVSRAAAAHMNNRGVCLLTN